MPITRSRWPLLAVIACGLALGAVLLGPQGVGAHAVLERSFPVQNQQLEEPPELVETWYSEPLERPLTTLQVLDTQGTPVHAGETVFSADDATYAAVALPPALGPGIYTVTYQNVSTVDGHGWSGSFSFVILNPDGSVPAGTAFGGFEGGGEGFLPGLGDTTLRWLGLVGAVALVGAMAFYVLIAQPAAGFLTRARAVEVEEGAMALAADIAVMALAVLVISVLGQLLLLADRLGGLDTVDNILLETRTGQLWLSRAGLSASLLLLLTPALASKDYRSGSRAFVVALLAGIGSVGLLLTYSLSSHAEAGGGAFWAVGSDFVHFLATAGWLGTLLQLPVLFWWTRRRLDGAERLLYQANVFDRFSWVAVVSVALLLGTGAFNGFVQLPTLESLWETNYGRVLIAKLALILPLLGMAGLNALFLKPMLVDTIDTLHEEGAEEEAASRPALEARLRRLQRALPRTVAAEFLLGVAVLASVSVLAQSTTADGELRLQAGEAEEDFTAVQETDELDLELSISPFGLSVNTFSVTLRPKPGQELGEVLAVRLIATFDDPRASPTAGASGATQELEATDNPAVWSADAALLTQPGDWRIETRVRRRGEDDAQALFSVPEVGGFLARVEEPRDMFDLPFTYVGWNVVAGSAMAALGVGAFLVWRRRPPSWTGATAASVGASSALGLIAGAVLLFGVDAHEGVVGRDSPIPATAESLAMGEALFETNCIACHGVRGEGDGPLADTLEFTPPRLGDHVPFHNDRTLFLWITEGIPLGSEEKNMPSFKGRLSEEERWHLVNFLRQTFGSGDFEPVLPEDLAQRR